MSDSVLIIAMLCIMSVATISIVAISTYFKDKFEFKLKTRFKNIANAEASITADTENTKK